jgi:lipoyl(octanoyl) transferase
VIGDWKNPDGIASASEDLVLASHEPPLTSYGNSCFIVDLGLIRYSEAYDLQKRLVAAIKDSSNRASSFTSPESLVTNHVLLLCEHPHVITLGRRGKREHLLASERVLQRKGVEFHATDRGGDITYHGPGQIVGYPILNLAAIRRDVGWYVRMLEETMIRATADFGITATREAGKTGIWVRTCAQTNVASEKLGAIGVHLSRWITSHGFAYNVSTELRYFDLIIPCGIADRKATSLERLLGRRVDRASATTAVVKHFGEVFGLAITPISRDELFTSLGKFEQQPMAIPA